MSDATLDERPARSHASQTHIDVIRRLQAKIDDVTRPFIGELQDTPYSLLDFPDYPNVGDSAIWAGQMAWLRGVAGSRPAYSCDHLIEMETLATELPAGPLFLSGGGNFGDLWELQQRFRESVYLNFGHRRIIQLPQSIHFDNPIAAERAKAAIGRTSHLTLLVRDTESLNFARTHFDCETRLCPDMAFALGTIERTVSPHIDVLLMLRDDKERGNFDWLTRLPRDWPVEDWLTDEAATYPRALASARLRAVLGLKLAPHQNIVRRSYYFQSLVAQRMRRGISQLSRARYVITDRLHVHILSTLMGIPHCFLDNSYGKISRFSRAFATQWDGCYSAATLAEAVEFARAWLAGTGVSHP